ncbi:zf-HC2 domain-containing protein, partial [bacterium]|nr:zf-HC2 domain-containing protein [bacterium]
MSACDELRPLVSALEDGELSASEAALVRSHLETCAACRQVRDDHARLSALVTAHASPPAIEASRWAELERKLDLELAGSSPPSSMRERRLAPLVALRPLLAAAAGAVLALGLARSLVFQEERIAVAFTPRHLPELSFREPSVTGLATGDEKPLPRGLEGVLGADAARSLTKAQREALERDGLVQVPGSGASLDPFYGERA